MRICVFAPHPDDAELHAGGAIAAASRHGHHVTIIDQPRGEMGGQPQQHGHAGRRSGGGGGDSWRHQRPKSGVCQTAPCWSTKTTRRAVADAIRDARPDQIWSMHTATRHPDHVALATNMVPALKGRRLTQIRHAQHRSSPSRRAYCSTKPRPIQPDLILTCRC